LKYWKKIVVHQVNRQTDRWIDREGGNEGGGGGEGREGGREGGKEGGRADCTHLMKRRSSVDMSNAQTKPI